jgi:DMSO/TMAO reductase YedYZ heme-binding membrane subunit
MSEFTTTNKNESSFSLQPALLRFTGIIVALLLIIPLLPGLISNLAYSFSGPAPRIYWYLSRSAGFVGLTNKMARRWPGAPTAFALHEYVSLLGLAFALYHGLILLGDHFVDFSLPRLMVPFSIQYKTIWVGLGQLAFYVWILAVMSFYVRRRIGQKTWRLIHYVNFATYIMGFLHGIFSGTDSNFTWARGYYWVSGGILLILLAYRLYDSPLKNKLSLSEFRLAWTQKFAKFPSRLGNA